MSATFSATFTGVTTVSTTAMLLSRLTLSVSACSFLKASANLRKNPFLVFTTSTVVLFASCVCGDFGCTMTESLPVLRLFTLSCR